MIKSVLEKEDSGSMVVHSLDQKETRGTKCEETPETAQAPVNPEPGKTLRQRRTGKLMWTHGMGSVCFFGFKGLQSSGGKQGLAMRAGYESLRPGEHNQLPHEGM